MAETQTVNFNWTMPDPGASANTWGATLNATTQKVDAQVFANQTAIAAGGAPIGSITMFGGATPPANWLLCQGQSLATTGTYAALFAILGYIYGGSGASFNLPDMEYVVPVGASSGAGYTLGSRGGEATHTLVAGELPVNAYSANDPGHIHSVSDPTHNHSQTLHNHWVNDPGHAHTGGYTGVGGGVPQNQVGGTEANTASTFTNISTVGAAANISAAATGVGVQANSTGITIQNAGGGAAHNNLPPYLAINFIIRFA